MQRAEMDRLIEQHLSAEAAGDTTGCVLMYTDDVIHDVVGAPHGPLSGPAAARGFYEMLTTNIKTERMDKPGPLIDGHTKASEIEEKQEDRPEPNE